ncbi:MAG: peptidase S8, partial [Microcoleus sp. PH2017_06_SFM_O_A]|nr:peptidase S8 [Microcoleus sp. PH2017_06_SFM_O_A]
QRRQLDTITVEKSPFCRLNSDCWDVKLEFFDPESSSRSRKVFRFTLDVVQPMPVTLGEVRSWSIPGKVS